jgi:DNA-binding CsgD family transcriptional regulator
MTVVSSRPDGLGLEADRPAPAGERLGAEQDLLGAAAVARVREAVDAALQSAEMAGDAPDRARGCAQLLALLHQQVLHVTANRDVALLELLLDQPDASNRQLAKRLNISRQRVDQLKRHLRSGGRRPRR